MSSRVGLIVPYYSVDSYSANTDDLIKKVTDNIGNLMFRYAMTKLIGPYIRVSMNQKNIKSVVDKVDVVVYPTANLFNPGITHLESLDSFFRALDKPVIMVGLGAQSEAGGDVYKCISEESRQFFRTMSSLSSLIGVRGEYTAQQLEKIGVKNTVVVGCPSNFISHNIKIGLDIERKFASLKDDPSLVRKSALFPQHGDAYMGEKHVSSERRLFDWARAMRGASYIVNGPRLVLALARKRLGDVRFDERKRFAEFLGPELSLTEFEGQFREVSTCLPMVEALLEHLSACDLAIGKRIHGIFASMQAGTPAVMVRHDSRTAELSDTTLTPSIELDEFERLTSIPDLLREVQFDGRSYDANRVRNFKEFQKLFAPYSAALNEVVARHPLSSAPAF